MPLAREAAECSSRPHPDDRRSFASRVPNAFRVFPGRQIFVRLLVPSLDRARASLETAGGAFGRCRPAFGLRLGRTRNPPEAALRLRGSFRPHVQHRNGGDGCHRSLSVRKLPGGGRGSGAFLAIDHAHRITRRARQRSPDLSIAASFGHGRSWACLVLGLGARGGPRHRAALGAGAHRLRGAPLELLTPGAVRSISFLLVDEFPVEAEPRPRVHPDSNIRAGLYQCPARGSEPGAPRSSCPPSPGSS